MAGPIINVNTVKQIDASAFVEQETKKLQNGKIRLGNSVYTVKFDNGKIKVGYQNCFLNLFNRNKSKEIKSHLQSKLTADKFVITENFNLAKKIGNDATVKQVILYGMTEVREVGRKGIEQAVEELKQEGKTAFKY